ncbi:hypothetical protein L5515_006580 [Caenorhabditis briggsae]|uniref:RRM domain-containing protein n=1 Tax=Caenorhabditis briggsae TaxID=6238 RepID=A0AAE9F102_CAEBR|nr:hypothetical protein L5515_006580 [Caenorhabditis briggsae]
MSPKSSWNSKRAHNHCATRPLREREGGGRRQMKLSKAHNEIFRMNKDVAIIDYMDSEAAGKAVRRLNHVEFDGRTLTVANA